MMELGANAIYFFPTEYYLSLVENLAKHVGVAVAWRERKPVAAALFLAGRQFAHYHLSGSTDEGRRLGAPTLLVVSGAQWASGRGCGSLHLGGACHNQHGVFGYKRGFGGISHCYYTLDLISDQRKYQSLTEKRINYQSSPRMRQDFFPEYRA